MANWTTLFASPADCECKDCNSIFSPAAYLVDIMQYLDHCDSKGAGSKSVLQVLFERRPDIGNLLLTCENTNTEIPYIDLVNEIMEYYVAHSQNNTIPFTAGDTGIASAEELKAEPQYILLDAYKQVYQKVYPFNLPYHQPLDVIRAYLKFLKTSRGELMEVFGKNPPNITNNAIPQAAIDAEWMQLSLNEYLILTGNDFSSKPNNPHPNVEDYFGNPQPQYTGNGIAVRDFLQRTGLQYTDLIAILETRFINPGQDAYNVLQNLLAKSPTIKDIDFYNNLQSDYTTLKTDNTKDLSSFTTQILNNAGLTSSDDLNNFKNWLFDNFISFQQTITLYQSTSACDLDSTFLHSIQWIYEQGSSDVNIDSDFLSRFHRFIRLWRKTVWFIHELDNMIVSLGETDITTNLITKLAFVTKVNAILNLPLNQPACLWGDIDTYGDNSANFPKCMALYSQLFLSSTGNVIGSGTQNQNIFAINPLNQIFPPSAPVAQIAGYLPEIFAALSISAEDYNAIIADAKPADNNVSLQNLSLLYRYKLLADALGLSVADLCTLKSNCFNIDPFTSPDNTFDFVQKVQKFQDAQTRQTALTVQLLNYVLSGSSKPIDNIALSQDAIFKVLPELRSNLLKLDNDNPASDVDSMTTDLLSKKLMLLYSKDIADQFILMLESSTPPALSVVVPDQSYTITTFKYSYNITLVYTSPSRPFQNEMITDSNGSTAQVVNVSDTKLTLTNVTLNGSKQSLEGLISGGTSTATVVSFTILFQLTGFMTDDEYNKIIASTGLSLGFKAAIDDLHQQSLTALYQESIIVASQVICVKPTDPQTVSKIPPTLSPKYSYSQSGTSWLLQCNGIMSDYEYSQLRNLGNDQFKSAVNYIYNYPYAFLKNNFSGVYSTESALDAACLYLFGLSEINAGFVIPVGYTPGDLKSKMQTFYSAFLPFIITQLKQKQITSSLSALAGLDISTLNGAMNVVDINNFINTITETGLDATYYKTVTLDGTIGFTRTDQSINFSWGADAPDTTVSADNFSVSWDGWICPPIDGDYNFTIKVMETDEKATLSIDGVSIISMENTVSKQGTVSMLGGKLYPIKITYVEITGNAGIQLLWQSPSLPQTIIDTEYLYPAKDIKTLLDKIRLYHRAAQVINGFALTASEVSYFISHTSDFNPSNLLPAIPIINIQWLRICDYSTIRKIIPANLLLTIFRSASVEEAANPGSLPSDDLISSIANANQPKWNKNYLSYLAGNSGISSVNPDVQSINSYFGFKVANFKNEIALLQIRKAMDLAIKTKMPVNTSGLPAWTVIETDPVASIDLLHPIAEQIKNAVEAKYKDNWLTIATQLNNPIRENQKQALISYLLTLQLAAPDGSGSDGSGKVTDADGLFEYLLTDVQMTSAVVTSRLIQATLAVQLFADRCLLGLETNVPLTSNAINPDKWEWMKHYSVAAGLKKIVPYVENYLVPSLRDDKSPFFLDFESAIKKGDITDENVENAFRDYLNKLNEVSNMEQCGMYYDKDTQTTYVFARTHAAPYNYYFRTATNTSLTDDAWIWTPWEQVQLDIKSIDDGGNSGVHLMPVLWKKKLFLFWPEFMEKAVNPTNISKSQTYQALSNTNLNDPSNIPQKHWEVRLAWSEYSKEKWTPKKLSKETISLNENDPNLNNAYQKTYFFRSDLLNDILTLNLYKYYSAGYGFLSVQFSSFVIKDIHEKLAINISSHYESTTPCYTDFESSAFYSSSLVLDKATFLQKNSYYNLLFSNDVAISDFEKTTNNPFLYTDTDNNRTYFVTPTGNFGYLSTKAPWPRKPNTIFLIITDKTNAPLSLYPLKVNSKTLQVKNNSLSKVSSPPREKMGNNSALQETTIASSENVTAESLTYIQTQAHPTINNFNNSIANQSVIGQIIAKGAQQHIQNTVFELPPFFSGQIIVTEVPMLGFYTFYHPFSSLLTKRLNLGGVASLLAANTADPISPYKSIPLIDNSTPPIPANDGGTTFSDTTKGYDPNPNFVQQYSSADPKRNYYLENVDFSMYGTYSSYNWELFFHAPFLIATSLSKNGKYAEARKWFHYIFNPSSTEIPDSPGSNSPFWQVLPFKTEPLTDIQKFIQDLQPGYDLNPTDATNDNNKQIDQWRSDPFNAFKIARARPIAFMKNVVMAYLDNLIAWGDDLFRTYIRENINEATQLYIIAKHILGPNPQYIPARGIIPFKSYNDLTSSLDDFGDAVVQLENAFPNSSEIQQIDSSVPQNLLGIGQALYFCIPPNDKLLGYWTTVGDRLFKIRQGENIDGVVVRLALYQPPIDPALLLQAKAQGLDITGILADLESPAPLYRFTYLLQKAKEFCNEVVSLGNAVISANEKQDAEQLSRLRQTQEIAMLNLVTDIKTRQVLEAQANLDNLNSSRTTALQRLQHYAVELLGNSQPSVPEAPQLPNDLDENSSLPGETIINQVTSSIDVSLTGTDESGVKIIPKEKQEMDDSDKAYDWQLGASTIEGLAGILHLIPTFVVHGDPFGVGVEVDYGGAQIGAAASALSKVAQIVSSAYSHSASQASRMAGFIRREQDWGFQANMTAREIIQLDKQIIAAQIRQQMAKHELDNHNTQIQNAQGIETFLETKFSKQELYDWMLDKLQDVHKQGYQLAYDMARKAEKAYRFELGIQESNFIQYGYFDDTYLGITAGEQLQLALNQIDSAYIESNVREFELVKHISIVQLDPIALIQLRETGFCQIDLPEELFDMDYPGHYFRRIKSVSISIPCVAGPYTTVNSTLRLVNNSIRIDTSTSNGYPRKKDNGIPAPDERFVENNIPFTAIATSSAQNDSGMFELNFRDERYLPFEGAGAISSWQLELNGKYVSEDGTVTDLSNFNYETITDILIHIKYTSREDNGNFRDSSIANLRTFKMTSSFRKLISVRNDSPEDFYSFINKPLVTGDQVLSMTLDQKRFPYFASRDTISIDTIELFMDLTSGTLLQSLTLDPAPSTNPIVFDQIGYGTVYHGKADYPAAAPLKANSAQQPVITLKRSDGDALTHKNLNNMYVVIHYSLM